MSLQRLVMSEKWEHCLIESYRDIGSEHALGRVEEVETRRVSLFDHPYFPIIIRNRWQTMDILKFGLCNMIAERRAYTLFTF